MKSKRDADRVSETDQTPSEDDAVADLGSAEAFDRLGTIGIEEEF